ncbi:MAG: DUF362 domain-containing protein [Spirochaetaceae bacterium]|nr:MAG: DUF362 domain-containing protein [Spirochaetaceae bacterium]
MERFLSEFDLLESDVVIKPNWTSADYGFYTDAQALELLLSCVNGRKYVVEGYMFGRTDGSIEINAANGRANWDWLREQDRRFLESTGMGELLAKYDVEYINVTEEWWSGRCVPESQIREIVETRLKPIAHQELYGAIPSKLFALRRLPLVSYSKFKYVVPEVSNFSSFSMKNMFGLIPVPNREHYHGADFDVGLSRSIVDIVSIYKALFTVIGLVEGVYHIPVTRPEGQNKYRMIWTEYDVIENVGLMLGSRDLLTLDAYANQLAGIDPETRAFLRIGEEVFGAWDRGELSHITDEMCELFR